MSAPGSGADAPDTAPPQRPARRGVVAGAGGLVVGAGVGLVAGRDIAALGVSPGAAPQPSPPARPAPAPGAAPAGSTGASGNRVAFFGPVQAGITRPEVPQTYLTMLVFDRRGPAAALWRRVERAARSLVSSPLGGLEATDLTVTVGVGRGDALAAYRELRWASDLPPFAREDLGTNVGGDLAIQLCASGMSVVAEAATRLLASLSDKVALRWRQDAYREAQDGQGVSRTLVGFPGGIALPQTSRDQDRGVWIEPPGGTGTLAGASYMVVRRLRVDLASWVALSPQKQAEAIGRDKATGAPLSGGGPRDLVDLSAEDSRGVWKIPPNAHTRRANAMFAGRRMMWRRSYSYANGFTGAGVDEGMLFICFVSDLATFVRTQRRLDQGDDLMALTTATASGAFLILPGPSPDAGWG